MPSKKPVSRLKKLVLWHGRTWISLLIGCASFFVLPSDWPPLSRVLVSWNFALLLFLTLIYLWMFALSPKQMHERFSEEDETAPVIVASGIVAALLSLVAIIEMLSMLDQATGAERTAHVALAALTVVTGWMLVPTMFTLHYADSYYSAAPNERPLEFPNTSAPVFWDFIYFSFTIAAACQTADVATNCTSIRKVVIAHSVISFLFNASILGFGINVTAGLFAK